MKPFLPVIIWLLTILILSGYPGNKIPKVAVWQFDKLVHSVIYFALSVCLLIPFHKQFIERKKRFNLYLIVILFSVFYGGLMEILQNSIFIKRSGNWYDFMANSIGAILGVLCYPLLDKYLPINRWFKIK